MAHGVGGGDCAGAHASSAGSTGLEGSPSRAVSKSHVCTPSSMPARLRAANLRRICPWRAPSPTLGPMSLPPRARHLAQTAFVGLVRFARFAAPVVRRGLERGGRALGRGLRALGHAAIHHRAGLLAASHRMAWWAALLLLVVGGLPVVGMEALPARGVALAPFVVGLLLCAAVRLLAGPRRLRVAALGLGALHGTAAALVWTAFAG
jgi:hypothetical protein